MYHHVGIATRFTPRAVLNGYASGYFPMGDPDGTIHWIVSDPRFVLPIGHLHVPKSLARFNRKHPFEIRFDSAFRRVMEHCAQDRSEENCNWIVPKMLDVYGKLHDSGQAHSVEAWLGGVLVGGLYGIALGGAFFGESMFTRRELGGTNASKVCLLALDAKLARGGFTLLDSQETNPHLEQFGGFEITFDEYAVALAQSIQVVATW